MLFKNTYQQALKAPTSRQGRGWAHAGAASMQAGMAMALGMEHCLGPQAIYDWANKHDVNLRDQRKRLMTPDLLLVAVLNDWTLDQTEKAMKE
jgi:hypothetical protein